VTVAAPSAIEREWKDQSTPREKPPSSPSIGAIPAFGH
jgi:hypothetical protein